MKKKPDSGLSRRDFLKNASAATLIGAAGVAGCQSAKESSTPASAGAEEEPKATTGVSPTEEARTTAPRRDAEAGGDTGKEPAKARVVLMRDEAVLDKGKRPVREVLARMVDEAVVALLGAADAKAAWASLVDRDDVVAVKSNQWHFLRTPVALEEILRERIEGAGVSPDRIAIADRRLRTNEVFARATALINVRPMRTHHWAGVGSLIKNYVNLHPKPSDWHDDSCANLAGLWEMPSVAGKTRLNILVMLTPLFHGKGPHHFHARYTWPYYGLLAGTDPVAVDATGLRILEAKRAEHFGKDRPFAVPPKHIRVAQEKYGLGIADPDRIELIRLGTQKDALI